MPVTKVDQLPDDVKAFKEAQWRRHDVDYYGLDQVEAYEAANAYRAEFHLVGRDDEGNLAGTMSGWVSEKVGFFSELIVSPQARGQGIGMELFEAAENLCADRGVTRLALRTDPKLPAIDLYIRRGWQVEFDVLDWIDGRTYVQMRKDLHDNDPRLADLGSWTQLGASITRTVELNNFAEAMAFANQVGHLAEAANHHPDIDIRWNKVRLVLSTHSAGGLTNADFGLARQIDTLI